MRIFRCASREELAFVAACGGSARIADALRQRGEATIVLATGLSQAEMLEHLVRERLDWSRVTAFHLDEYVGMPETHPASFRRYLKERFVDRVPLRAFHPICADRNPVQECRRLNRLVQRRSVDVAFVGIGENAHLAFNDPPADFSTESSYLIVKLDKACRRQQVKEGWFGTLAQVPTKAITMSIRQILGARHIICTVPDRRKAKAVRAALEGEVTPEVPASILREHPEVSIYLDPDSAALLPASGNPIVIETFRIEECPVLRAPSRHFHLFLGGDFAMMPEQSKIRFSRRALDAGAVTLTAWGRGSGGMELIFDNEAATQGVRRGGGRSTAGGIETASYKVEDLHRALFHFLDAPSPSPEVIDTCSSWVVVLAGLVSRREEILEALADRGRFMDGYINQDIPSNR